MYLGETDCSNIPAFNPAPEPILQQGFVFGLKVVIFEKFSPKLD